MTIANSIVAKLSVALVAVAMMVALVAPTAQAATAEETEALIADLMSQIAALTAQMGLGGSTPAASSCDSIPAPLTIGAQNANVTALQNVLIAAGQTIPAGATGYFGGQTQSALAGWQAANGVAPAVGYYGPITQAAMDAQCVPADDSMDDSDDDMDDSDDSDDSDSDDDSNELGNDEGDIDSIDEVAADESSLEEGLTSGMLAFELEIDGDVEINRVDFYMANTAAGSHSSDPDDYFAGASLFVDGDEVANLDVDDWNEDAYTFDVVTNSGDEYRIRFTGLDLVFEDGDEPEFQLALEAVNNIDSGDIGETWGIDMQTDSIRFVDGQGFTDTAGDATVEDAFSFDAETVAELSISESSDSPDADTFEVSDTGSTDDVSVFMFDIDEDEGVDVTIDDLTVTVTTTGTTDESAVVEQASLYQGSTKLGSESVPAGGIVQFENLGLEIEGDDEAELTVKLDFADADGYSDGDTVQVSFTSIDDATDANGNDENDMTIAGTPAGDTHTLREVGVSVSLSSESITSVENDDTTDADDAAIFKVVFDVEAFGDDLYLPFGSHRTATTGDGITWEILDDNGAVVSTGTTTPSLDVDDSGTEQTNGYLVQKDDTERFTLEVTFDPAASGSYKLRVNSINWALTDATTTAFTQSVTGQDIDSAKETIQS